MQLYAVIDMVYILIAPYSQDLIKVYEIKFSSDNISHFMEIKAYTITKKEENWIFCINIYICMNWYTYHMLHIISIFWYIFGIICSQPLW